MAIDEFAAKLAEKRNDDMEKRVRAMELRIVQLEELARSKSDSPGHPQTPLVPRPDEQSTPNRFTGTISVSDRT